MIKKLSPYIGEFKLPSLLTPLCMIVEVVCEMVIPLMIASLVDKGVTVGSLKHVVVMGLAMAAVSLVGLLFGSLGAIWGAKASTGFARNLRQGMFEHIQTFSFANIDHFSTAGLVTRLTTDVTNIQNAYQMILRMCFRAPISLICAIFMAFRVNSQMAMIYVWALLFLSVCLVLIMGSTMKIFPKVFEKYDDLNASVQENVSAIRVVKAYVREKFENAKFKAASGNLYNLFVKAERRMMLVMPLMQLTIYSCILLISWKGAHLIIGGTLTTGELMSLFTYCMNILMSLMMVAMVFVMISMSMASARRISEVLSEDSSLTNGENPVMEVADGSIDFEDASFAYKKDGAEVLSHIDLHIPAGATIGILGGTGSAKSSLVQLIPRLYDVTGGCVKVGGLDVRRYDLDTLRGAVAMVLQKNVLFRGTIYENLRWGDENATDEQCREACRLACADEFIDTFPDGYETMVEQGGANLSGGQKQRLCIARALLKNPKVLILDDSTSAVDTATDARIRAAFAEKIPGVTKLIVAQRISSIQHADSILVLDDGRISGFGTHKELLNTNPIYQEVYRSQIRPEDQEGGEA